MTRVIDVRDFRAKDLLADSRFVFVGRAVVHAGWPFNDWGNPCRSSARDGDSLKLRGLPFADLDPAPCVEADPECVQRFRHWFYEEDSKRAKTLRQRIKELRGKVLGCFCCDWTPGQPIAVDCHAIALAQYADGQLL